MPDQLEQLPSAVIQQGGVDGTRRGTPWLRFLWRLRRSWWLCRLWCFWRFWGFRWFWLRQTRSNWRLRLR